MHCIIVFQWQLLFDLVIFMHFTLMLLVGRQEGHAACKKTEWWGAGVVVYLEQGADLHMAQLMPLPLTVSCSSKSRLILPFWFYLFGSGSPRWSRTKSRGL